ncbi:MAG: TIM barrel protein [Lentisphaerae bacterium]|nr:TIM barrel protein [Lentisphaerota bacterium]
MNAKLAYAVWTWGLEKPEQLRTALKDIKDAGFRAFESVVSTVTLFKSRPAEFKAIVEEHQVFPVSFYFWMRNDPEQDVRLVEESMEFLAANNVKRCSVQAPGKQGGGATPEELKLLLKTLERMCKAAKQAGVTPCLHPHANTQVMFEDEIHFVLRNMDPALLSFGPDTAHLAVGRCDPVALFNTYAGRIRFVHLKDVRKTKEFGKNADGTKGFEVYGDFLEMGEGEVDFDGVFKALERVNYDGYLTVELDKTRTSNRDSAFKNMQYLKTRFPDRFGGA